MRTGSNSQLQTAVFGKRRVTRAALVGIVLAGAAGALWAQTAQEAARLYEVLALEPGMTVGEIGAGRGEMTVELAKRVGPGGHVYSTEVDATRLADIRAAVSREQLANVTVVEAGERATNLLDACCDAIFMRDVYHHLTYPDEIGRSVFAALKPGGRLAVIDFEPSSGSTRPDGVPANREGHGVTPDTIVGEMGAAKLSLIQTISDWAESNPRNRRMFLVLFEKPE